jgi:flagellar P-ring protein precursor FlgI
MLLLRLGLKFSMLVLVGLQPLVASAERIKDIANISGIRSNQLVGYGLVIGLDGTGDSNAFTNQSFKTMLARLGVQMPSDVSVSSKNIAAVALHADLPPFARQGQKIDITISSIGNAKSLRGGSLLMSQLKGADGNVYAMAQGNLVVGGFSADGRDGSKITVNLPVVGRIPSGAIVERDSPSSFDLFKSEYLTFILHRADFTTANRLAQTINSYMGVGTAIAQDASSIKVTAPQEVGARVKFLAVLENLSLNPGEEAAKVIINSRTGTIVIGENVKVGAAAVSHGALTVTITENTTASQALPFASNGTTQIIENSNITINQPNNKMFLFPRSVSLNNIVSAVNEVGAAPSDLMAILEALKQVGALSAEIEIM